MLGERSEQMWAPVGKLEEELGITLRYRLREDPNPQGPPDGHTIRFRYTLQKGKVFKEAYLPDVEAFIQHKGLQGGPPPEGWLSISDLVHQGVDRYFIHNILNRRGKALPRWRASYKRIYIPPEVAAEILAAWRERRGGAQ